MTPLDAIAAAAERDCPICGGMIVDPIFLVDQDSIATGPGPTDATQTVAVQGVVACRRHSISPRIVGRRVAQRANAIAFRYARRRYRHPLERSVEP